MTPRMLVCMAGVLLAVSSTAVTAQPLAEIARLEKSRRAELAKKAASDDAPPKVYTIADVNNSGHLTTGGAPPPSSAEPEEPPADGEPTDEAGEALDEEAWRSRISAIRESQVRAELMAEALQNRVDSLWADYTARDDPAQRAVLEQNRQTAVDELADTQSQIEALTQEMADIRREARRASVPPGWLR
jgi:hypothetical protein